MSDSPIVRPGDLPPDLLPYCQLCDVIVERLWIHPFKYPHQDFIELGTACCGRESYHRIPLKVVFGMRKSPEKWYAIVKRKGVAPGVKAPPKSNGFRGMYE